jgi:hypothetical protein
MLSQAQQKAIIWVHAAVEHLRVTELFLYVTENINSTSKLKTLSTTEYLMENAVCSVLLSCRMTTVLSV